MADTMLFVYLKHVGRRSQLMPKLLYCWRCRMDVPMLDDAEWEQVVPHLMDAIARIKDYRQMHSSALFDVQNQGFGRDALEKYHEITGFTETNVNALWHHRVSQFGPPCSSCGRPLRTPRASFCAECGALRKKL
jgi:hypothetical protein